jgi:hypothetical protein
MAKTIKIKKMKSTKKEKKELTRLGSALRYLGGLGGGAVGTLVGMPAGGSSVGTSLGAALSRWLGSGDYEVVQNSLVRKASTGIPMMHKTDQVIVIRHREYIGEIKGSQAFTVQRSLSINPGLSATFPWLSTVAGSFQTYKIRGAVYHYIPTSGNAVSSTNNALGSVMFQTSYRANDTPPSSKVEMLNEYWSSEVVPSETVVHPIECAPKENPFQVQYVRTQDVPAGDNVLLYDLGVTHIATSGMQADGVVLGDVWLTYEIELAKPIVASNVTSQYKWASLENDSPTSTDYFGGLTSTAGTMEITTSSARQIYFPVGTVGTYFVQCTFLGTFTDFIVTNNPSVNNCTITQLIPGTTRFEADTISSTSSANITYEVAVTITDPSQVASLSIPTSSGGTISRVILLVSRRD